MMERTSLSKNTRKHRSVHRWLAPAALLVMTVMSVTGLLLGWKKHSNGWLMADNAKGVSTDMKAWLSLDSLNRLATCYLRDSIDASLDPTKDRIEFRPEKGMVKFTFTEHYHALQIDATTGRLLKTEIRRADWIERLHDGSLIDRMFNIGGQAGKLTYSTLAALLLFSLTLTGAFLWINPKRLRRQKRRQN
jgi:uncharacterized iron-regulated membrane protein